MSKYRIVRIEYYNNTRFQIQEKGFLWGWNDCSIYDRIMRKALFSNIDDAVNIVKAWEFNAKPKKTVVWPYSLLQSVLNG
jgi:hypothetical protein